MIPQTNKPTLDDLKLWLSDRELRDLSNPQNKNNCDSDPAVDAVLQNGIDLADGLWCGKYIGCKPEGKIALMKIRKTVTLMITRYFLDREKLRPTVVDQYKEAMKLMEMACCAECGGEISAEDAELIGWTTSTSKVYVYSEPTTLDRNQTVNYQRGGLIDTHRTRLRNSSRQRYTRP